MSYYSQTQQRQLDSLKDIFRDTTYQESDLVSVLEEVQGDLQSAIDRLTAGNVNTWETKSSAAKSEKKILVKNDSKQQQGNFQNGLNARGGAGRDPSFNNNSNSTRGGRGGRGSRGRGGRAGFTSSDRHQGHGGENRAQKTTSFAPSAEGTGENTWGDNNNNASSFDHSSSFVASNGGGGLTDDWGNEISGVISANSNKTNEQDGGWHAAKSNDWNTGSTEHERDSQRPTMTKKGYTVVKAAKTNTISAVAAPKTNWASIVKGPEPVVVTPAPTPVPVQSASTKPQVTKKLNLVKKDQIASTGVSAPAPVAAAPAAVPVQEWNTSPLQKSVHASPLLHAAVSQPSPVLRPASPPKSYTSPILESSPSTVVSHANSGQVSSSQMPPGLGPKLTKKPKAQQSHQEGGSVVLPAGMAGASTTSVQFGSFGISKQTHTAVSESNNPKSPDRSEEAAQATTFQFNPPQNSTSSVVAAAASATPVSSSRPTTASTEQTVNPSSQIGGGVGINGIGAAPGLQHYQQPHFGLGNYSMYDSEQQQRAMGYYPQDTQSYGAIASNKYQEAPVLGAVGNASQSPATQHAQQQAAAAAAAAAMPQQAFQHYGYYPQYYQYQQSPYQPQQPVYQQQHFGGNKYGGAAGFQGGASNGPVVTKANNAASTSAAAVPTATYPAYGQQQQQQQQQQLQHQQFYPGYEDPYGKSSYGGNGGQNFFGGEQKAPQQNHRGAATSRPYEGKQQPAAAGGVANSAAAAAPAAVAAGGAPIVPTTNPYYAAQQQQQQQQQFPGMYGQQQQPFMMHQHPQGAYNGGGGGYQSRQQYWNGN